ncbi:hypothetical protein DMB44_07290 [Thermoplasma sp. Kam2015]|uniref:YceI family protein n=1 Tax=Thermoplasma sp. Kam2015 TaxID=2094122 RepID=UPI000D9B47FC|nr:YceI family protein [Thermoplasma sp. Kam2015]PYB67686.1 hypothetical protein DMB44_07290 [Thermoplasma sp. Kam2015]
MESRTCNYVLSLERSQINFTITHLVLSKVSGQFRNFSGCLSLNDEEFVDRALLRIDVSSVQTGNSVRDRNLMKKGYFNTSEYRYIEAEAREVDLKQLPSKPVNFNIRIKEIEEIVPLNVLIISVNREKIELRITGKIRTQDFGLRWQSPLKPGLMIGSEANLSIFLSFFRGEIIPENLGNTPSLSSSTRASSHRR